jgi:hypothetical protein
MMRLLMRLLGGVVTVIAAALCCDAFGQSAGAPPTVTFAPMPPDARWQWVDDARGGRRLIQLQPGQEPKPGSEVLTTDQIVKVPVEPEAKDAASASNHEPKSAVAPASRPANVSDAAQFVKSTLESCGPPTVNGGEVESLPSGTSFKGMRIRGYGVEIDTSSIRILERVVVDVPYRPGMRVSERRWSVDKDYSAELRDLSPSVKVTEGRFLEVECSRHSCWTHRPLLVHHETAVIDGEKKELTTENPEIANSLNVVTFETCRPESARRVARAFSDLIKAAGGRGSKY